MKPDPQVTAAILRRGDRARRDAQAEETATAICPVCQGPMVARCHPVRGPYFHCRCAEPASVLRLWSGSMSNGEEDGAHEDADLRAAEKKADRGQDHALTAHANGRRCLPQAKYGGHQAGDQQQQRQNGHIRLIHAATGQKER